MAGKRRTRYRPICSRLVNAAVFALLFVLSLPLSAQDQGETEDAAELFVALRTPQFLRTSLGRSATVEFVVEDVRRENLRILLPDFSDPLQLEDGPRVSFSEETEAVVTFSLSASRRGRYFVPAVRVLSSDGRQGATPAMLLEVASTPDADDAPFRADWRPLRETIYQEQSVPVVIELNLIEEFVYPELEKVRAPASGLFEEVSGLGDVEIRELAGRELYRLPAASFLFTPADSGPVELPGTFVRAAGETIEVPSKTINVRQLPAEVRASGAVGRFTLETSIESTEARPGSTVQVTATIRGAGNLTVLQLPEPQGSGVTEVGREESSEIGVDEDTLLGYRGYRRTIFRFEILDAGPTANISIPDFVWFDPVLQRTRVAEGASYEIEVSKIDEDESAPVDLVFWEPRKVSAIRWQAFYRSYWIYALFLVIPLLRGGIAIWNVRNRYVLSVTLVLPLLLSNSLVPAIDLARIEKASVLAEQGRWETAGVLYDLELQDNRDNAALHRNRAVAALNAGRNSRALHHIRRAVRLRPDSSALRADIEAIEESLSVDQSVVIPKIPRWETWVAVAFGLWTGIWLLGLMKQGPARQIARLLLSVVFVGAVGLVVFSHRLAATPEATVVTETTLYRIPDDRATPWVSLSGGVPVTVELHWNRFYLIRTPNGVEGWIPQTALYYEDDAQ